MHVLGAVGGVQQRLGARRRCRSAPRSSTIARMPAPDGVAPGSKVARATSPSLVSHSCSRRTWVDLPGALAALEGDEHAAAGQPAAGGGVAAQRGDDVGQQRHRPAVVHLPVGDHADGDGQQPGRRTA